MANFPSDHMTARSGRDAWMHDNERGLALAADGDWAEASEAFAAAADSLARTLPSDPRNAHDRSSHEPLALVLNNLAQAYYRSGRLDEAMQQAQRACALRVAIAGEDGMPVARARMDLAVMLATAGRLDEATTLVQRAISAIEHRVGEEDARLAIVLENAARIALAAGQPANAEPLLIRLHALLDAHELSTSRAEELLARVAAVRTAQQAVVPEATSNATANVVHETAQTTAASSDTPPALAAFEDDATARIYAHASIAEHEEWEDQPLRDAVAVTDVLLRTTPSGVPIIPTAPVVEPPSLEFDAHAADEADALLDTMDLTDVLPAPSLREPDAEQLLSLDPTPAQGVEFDLDLAFDDTPTPKSPSLSDLDVVDFEPSLPAVSSGAAASEPPASPRADAETAPPMTVGALTLDFAVEHGMISDDEPILQGPPISSPVPEALDVVPMEPPTPTIVPVTQIVSSGPTNGIAPLSDIVQTAPVMDAPAAKAPRPTSPAGERQVHRTSEERVVMPKAEPASGKGKLIAIIAGVVAVGGGAAAFFLLR